ncbi:unnamed protein product [Rhizopus stolonifer]
MEKPASTTVEGLRLALEELGLNTKGQKAELKQRLRKAKKKLKELEEKKLKETEENKKPKESKKLDGKTFDIVDEFRSYVKPTINPTLSDFCMKLTGITQDIVDASPIFIDALNQFQEFLGKYSLFQSSTAVFVTDGPFDIRDFVTKQLAHSNISTRPGYFNLPWINIRKLFKTHYRQTQNKNIGSMLSHLDMKFEGREHSGLDDARNLANIAKRMHKEGCIFKPNCKLQKREYTRKRR